ncbi:MAG: hypothetical protein E7359_03495 [Clostridiales bacterium]|nr:hypothetical protein [Clostridiales bacterium]
MSDNLILKKNAKIEECKAYYLLKDILFFDKIVVVGDDISKNLPDVYTKDLSIGVEVTSCEHISQFLVENYNKTNNKTAQFIIDEYEKLSLKDKNLLFMEEFEKVLEKKIKKIPNYKSCESLNLIIVSDNENKNYLRRDSLAEIYENLSKKHNKKYNNLFLYYNDTLYVEINYTFVKLKKVKLDKLKFDKSRCL